MFTDEEINYLENKHRGGVNNAKGCRYEDFYAIFEIVDALNCYPGEYKNVEVASQIEKSFVDDLFLKYPSEVKCYFQLKNTKSLGWGKDSEFKTLAYDFKRQHEVFGCNCILGVSNNDIFEEMSDLPVSLRGYTEVKHLPYFKDLSLFVLQNDKFRGNLSKISGYEDPFPDQLTNLATVILGVWCGLNGNYYYTLDTIVDTVNQIAKPGINFFWMPVINIQENTKKILGRVKEFHYKIQHSAFLWCYKWDAGELNSEQFQIFEQRLLLHPEIDNFEQLEEILTI